MARSSDPAGSGRIRYPGSAFLRQVGAILLKDLAAERRTGEQLSAMLVFAVLALLSFGFALDLHGAAARAAAPGVLWTTVIFAGTLGLNRSLAREEQNGGFDGLRLAPIDPLVIFLGKAAANWILMSMAQIVLVPLCAVLFDAPLMQGEILGVLLLGTLGYAAVGTLLATIAVNSRAREVLLPILLLPLAVPLLIAVVRATGALLAGAASEAGGWIQLIVVYDLVITAVAVLTFDALLAD